MGQHGRLYVTQNEALIMLNSVSPGVSMPKPALRRRARPAPLSNGQFLYPGVPHPQRRDAASRRKRVHVAIEIGPVPTLHRPLGKQSALPA